MTSRIASRLCTGLLVLISAGLPAVFVQAQSTTMMPQMHWRNIGPFRGGRTRAATGIPGQPNVFYVGQVDGGIWKSTDYGRTWNPIFDKQDTQSIGAIAVAPSDSNIIYVASGEGLHRPDLSTGDGIYRSDDGGKTWTHLGLRDSQQIPALVVDPHNPDRAFAAVLGHPYGPSTERGIYRTTDGGKTWTRVLYKNDRTGGSKVLLDPQNPNVVYASMWEETLGPWEDGNEYSGASGGLFKSTDGGNTWTQLKKGLPENLAQINITMSPSYPQRMYATLSTTGLDTTYASHEGLGVYRSDDAGETWRKITNDPRPAMKIGGGDLPVPVVDPKNPDVLYSTSIVTCKSTDGGKTWISLRGAPGGDDYQNMWINPDNPDIILLVSDQGALVSVNGGGTWSSWYNQPTAQLYHVAATNTFPYKVCAGQQESGSVCISSRGNDGAITFREWHPAGIIEYGYAAPDPLHPNIVYGAGRTEVSRYDSVTGEVQNITPLPLREPGARADRTEPIEFSPVNPHILYYAANRLYKTTNYGHTWQAISPDLSQSKTGQPASVPPLPTEEQDKRRGAIYALAASYKNTTTLWAGTDDGLVWITRDGGARWRNITPQGVTPWSKIAQIDASRFDDNTAYVAVNRMRINDMHPYAFRTHDGGKTWQSISDGLPDDAPVNAVRVDPEQPGLLYAATERSVFVSFDDGDHWHALQYNLPHTSMRDLLVHEGDLIVATHGRAFWILDDVAPLREIAAAKGKLSTTLLKPGPVWRVRRDNYTDTPLPADEPMGENPPVGAPIDFWLPSDVQGAVKLEILDDAGKVIRTYASTNPAKPTPEQLRTNLIPAYWPKINVPLPATPGMHRWIWDLRSTTPTAIRYEYPISAVPHRTPLTPQGPLVLPGTYKVRLTVNGHSEMQSFTVKLDPRIHTTPIELAALHHEQMRMADILDRISKADLEAHSIMEQLLHVQEAGVVAQLEPYKEQIDALVKGKREGGKEGAPGLDDLAREASQVYGQLEQADNPPTDALLQAAAHLHEEAEEIDPKWQKFLSTQKPAIDRILVGAHLPSLDAMREPDYMPSEGDED